jgi:AcrR family transcriptional regulator
METVRLLWRQRIPVEPRRGRPARVGVDAVVASGIAVADRIGNLMFGMRDVARHAGVPVMTLYSSVTGREQLLALMIDDCRARMRFTPLRGGWRQQLGTVASDNRKLLEAHPWLADVESERAVLGPGTLAKYERELSAVAGMELRDADRDAALSLVIDFVRASVRAMREVGLERATESAADWWAREGELLAQLGVAEEFPLASRIGTAAGQAHHAAGDPERGYEFGLSVILDGLAARLASSGR